MKARLYAAACILAAGLCAAVVIYASAADDSSGDISVLVAAGIFIFACALPSGASAERQGGNDRAEPR